ncbi:MAG: hypothetical protein AAF502_23730 [Bacteroidota bacterium]
MQNSKLINILRCFTPKQLRQFDEFLQSPFFNKNEDLNDLFHYLLSVGPGFKDSQALEATTVFAKTFPERDFDKKQFGYWLSDLLKLAERYIAHSQLDNMDHFHTTLLEHYHNHQLEKGYKSALKEAEKALQKDPFLDSSHYYTRYRIATINNEEFDRLRKTAYDASLQEALDNLDIFYLSAKLRHSCELINRHNVVKGDYELPMINELSAHIEANDFSNYPSVLIYHQILKTLLQADDESHFTRLKALLSEHAHLFPQKESASMYLYALNYAVRKANQGQTHFLKHLFHLFRETLEKELIFENGYLTPGSYKNIVSTALRIKEYEWTRSFIYQYKDRLQAQFRKNAFNYNLANLIFHQKQFGEALQLLHRVEFTDIYYNLDSKTLMMKSFYELDESEALRSHIHAFKIFLKRNKLISAYVKEIYLNLAEFTRRMDKLDPRHPEAYKTLLEEVNSTKKVANINWLTEKLRENI